MLHAVQQLVAQSGIRGQLFRSIFRAALCIEEGDSDQG